MNSCNKRSEKNVSLKVSLFSKIYYIYIDQYYIMCIQQRLLKIGVNSNLIVTAQISKLHTLLKKQMLKEDMLNKLILRFSYKIIVVFIMKVIGKC